MRNFFKIFFLFFFGFAGIPTLFAQNTSLTRIHGQVQDQTGKAVSGANVFIKGTIEGAGSDENGLFSFETTLSGDTVLLIRHIAMEDQEITITISPNLPTLQLRLNPKTNLVS